MTRHKANSTRTIILVTLMTLCASVLYYFAVPSSLVAIHADHAIYNDVQELLEYADLILVGKVTKDFSSYEPTVRYTSKGTLEDFYTITDVQVVKQIKGDVVGSTLPVLQGAAYIKMDPLKNQKDLLTIEGFYPMEQGGSYLLFLKATRTGAYSIIGVNQGKFNVDSTDEHERAIEVQESQFGDLKAKVLQSLKSDI